MRSPRIIKAAPWVVTFSLTTSGTTAFKARGTIPEEKLNQITEHRYPTPAAFEKDLPNIMVKLGFTKDEADDITSLTWKSILPADQDMPGGHRCVTAKSHLRTRVPAIRDELQRL